MLVLTGVLLYITVQLKPLIMQINLTLEFGGLQVNDLKTALIEMQSKTRRPEKKQRIQLIIDQLQKIYEGAYNQAVTEYFRN